MKTNIKKFGATLLAVGICTWGADLSAQQTTTTVTTSNGAFTEFVPGSETVVVKSETTSTPLRYSVTKQTTIVDETGAPVTIQQISPGSPLSVQYTGAGENLVASRIVVKKARATSTTTTTVPATTTTTVPATATTTQTTTGAPVRIDRSSTTTTTRTLSRDEKEAREERREKSKEQAEDEIERRKDAVEDASDAEKDRLDDLKDKIEDDN